MQSPFSVQQSLFPYGLDSIARGSTPAQLRSSYGLPMDMSHTQKYGNVQGNANMNLYFPAYFKNDMRQYMSFPKRKDAPNIHVGLDGIHVFAQDHLPVDPAEYARKLLAQRGRGVREAADAISIIQKVFADAGDASVDQLRGAGIRVSKMSNSIFLGFPKREVKEEAKKAAFALKSVIKDDHWLVESLRSFNQANDVGQMSSSTPYMFSQMRAPNNDTTVIASMLKTPGERFNAVAEMVASRARMATVAPSNGRNYEDLSTRLTNVADQFTADELGGNARFIA